MNHWSTKLCILACALAANAHAGLIINPTFNDAQFAADGYTAGDITNIHNAFNFAAAEIQTSFADNIHVNIDVTSSSGVGLGQSSTSLLGFFSYVGIQAALAADVTTANDASAVATLPGSNPTPSDFLMARAQAKALGAIADDLVTDGTFTFGSAQSYTFDPLNRSVSGKFDFIGVAQHEISEIMGRFALLGSVAGGYGISDLYRYTAPGATNVIPSATGVYFSVDGGNTNLVMFNSNPAGDLADYAGVIPTDPFNAFTGTGQAHVLSAVGLTNLDVIGYDLVTVETPEPTTFAMLGFGLAGLAAVRRRLVVA